MTGKLGCGAGADCVGGAEGKSADADGDPVWLMLAHPSDDCLYVGIRTTDRQQYHLTVRLLETGR